MTTSIPSGLGASFGLAAETTVGTLVAPARWLRFDNEAWQQKKIVATSMGLHQGLYQESKRRNFVAKDVNGAVTLDLAQTQYGLLFKHMLGVNTTGTNSVPQQLSASSAWKTNYGTGDQTTLGLSVQVGRPLTSGTLSPFSYRGAKITDWTLSVDRGQLAKLALSFDAWDENVSGASAAAYVAPTLQTPNLFDFSQAVLKLGGTPSTTTGLTSISGNAAPTGVVSRVMIKGTNPLKADRFNIGSTTKSEQLANAFRTIDVEVTAEFATLADFYTSLFATDTSTALQLTFTGGLIPSGSSNSFILDVIVPAVFWDEVPYLVAGPDVITATVKGTALDNGADNPVQFTYTSTDTAI